MLSPYQGEPTRSDGGGLEKLEERFIDNRIYRGYLLNILDATAIIQTLQC